TGGGAAIVGSWVSCTVTLNEQVSFDPSVRQLTVVVPTGKNDPEAGSQTMVPAESGATTSNDTLAPHLPGSVPVTTSEGRVSLLGPPVPERPSATAHPLTPR